MGEVSHGWIAEYLSLILCGMDDEWVRRKAFAEYLEEHPTATATDFDRHCGKCIDRSIHTLFYGPSTDNFEGLDNRYEVDNKEKFAQMFPKRKKLKPIKLRRITR